MMLHKLPLSATSFNLKNQKRTRPTSLVANIGPILQSIKKTLYHNATQRSNTIHCLSEYQESTVQQNTCWLSQETKLYALIDEKSTIGQLYNVQPRENWWSF